VDAVAIARGKFQGSGCLAGHDSSLVEAHGATLGAHRAKGIGGRPDSR
jgi:hypothetical protein